MPGTTRSYNSLEPSLSQSLGLDALSFSTANPVSFLATTNFLYSLAIMLSVLAAGFIYARAGLWRMQASEAGVRKSNEEIRRATLGLLGVLSLFVILYTFNKGLLSGEVGLKDLRTNMGTVSPVPVPTSPAKTSPTPSIPATNDDPTGWAAIKNDAAVRDSLKPGITVNKNVCINPTQTSCTTVGGLPEATLSMLRQLRATCPGTIAITGGSEAGHASHGPGKSPVDISLNDSPLESCIRNFPKGPPLSFCYRTYTQFGYVFCDEINSNRHWHVQK